MLRQRTRLPRISGLATPSICPSSTSTTSRQPCSRLFTHKPPLQVLAPQRGRPQLSFLNSSPVDRALPPLSIHLRQSFARLVSTESRRGFKKQASYVLRLTLTVSAMIFCVEVIMLGIQQENMEHKFPTPPEWSFKSRWYLRAAEGWQHPEEIGKLRTEWSQVVDYCQMLLERLEDTEGEGKGIVEQEEGGLFVEGVGKTGFDITAKSEPWRRGYFQALLGAAKAAENLEGWLTDLKMGLSGDAKYFVGPSNPRPKPMPKGQKAPREEDAEPTSPSPEVFYVKILTTRGFDTGQKVEAAIAYADWLDYKKLPSTAAEVYSWALDIAASGFPEDAAKVVDMNTGVVKTSRNLLPSENILRVLTALAVHHAQQGNLPMALSIFTSVLQARRALPPPPSGAVRSDLLSAPESNHNPITSLFNTVKRLFNPPEYPPPPASGNDTPVRAATSSCEEAGLMTYIGEIIYASSSKEKGLVWTRDAMELAESTLFESNNPSPKNRCAECLRVGLQNWRVMVSKLVKQAQLDEEETINKSRSGSSWFGPSKKQIEAKAHERKRWEAEGLILEERIQKLRPLIGVDLILDGIVTSNDGFSL
ncbi:hypothetical protein BJY04DRAFT_158619 [Aspergillus karnatakaensis]|uniref:uncharacterized protein n=1 Tax=Aspergillus karnatakaensis TaxID=1810916 RepID=UPI003CCCE14D